VYFSTSSEALARDVMALLLRFGIVARLRATLTDGARPVYSVDVSGAEQQRRFLAAVPAFGPRAAPAARLHSYLAGVVSNSNVDTLPAQVFAQVRTAMHREGVTQRAVAAVSI